MLGAIGGGCPVRVGVLGGRSKPADLCLACCLLAVCPPTPNINWAPTACAGRKFRCWGTEVASPTHRPSLYKDPVSNWKIPNWESEGYLLLSQKSLQGPLE